MAAQGGGAAEGGTGAQQEQSGWVLGAPRARQSTAAGRPVPPGVAVADVAVYSTMLGDDALLMAHRLSDWGLRAPTLQESAELARTGFDLLEQARALLARAGELSGTSADRLAHHRDAAEFRNVRLAEIDCGPGPGGDYAATIARLLLFATWRRALVERLRSTADPVLSELARRFWPELQHAQAHAEHRVLDLSRGGPGPRRRVLSALHRVWPLAGELFAAHPVESRLAAAGVAVDPDELRGEVAAAIGRVLAEAGLQLPDLAESRFAGGGGRHGVHTESMPFVLAEMQHLVRADPIEVDDVSEAGP